MNRKDFLKISSLGILSFPFISLGASRNSEKGLEEICDEFVSYFRGFEQGDIYVIGAKAGEGKTKFLKCIESRLRQKNSDVHSLIFDPDTHKAVTVERATHATAWWKKRLLEGTGVIFYDNFALPYEKTISERNQITGNFVKAVRKAKCPTFITRRIIHSEKRRLDENMTFFNLDQTEIVWKASYIGVLKQNNRDKCELTTLKNR